MNIKNIINLTFTSKVTKFLSLSLTVLALMGFSHSTAASTIFVQGSASATSGGDGSQNNPYRSLMDAQNHSGWSKLVVLPSSVPLDGGIQLKDGQSIQGGGCDDNSQHVLQNTTSNLNGDVIVAAGNNVIKGISIPTAVRVGINGGASKDLTVECVKIRNTNTVAGYYEVLYDTTGPSAHAYAGIDLMLTPNSGKTVIKKVDIQDLPQGINLSTSGSAERTYSVKDSKIRNITYNVPAQADAIDVVVTNTSSQSGVVDNIEVNNASSGVIYFSSDTARLPNTSVINSRITNTGSAVNYAWRTTIYDGSLPPEKVTVKNNKLPDNFFTTVMISWGQDFRAVVDIDGNEVINRPGDFWGDTFLLILLPSANGSPNSNDIVMNIKNNIIANNIAETLTFNHILYSGEPSIELNIDNNRIKDVGAVFFSVSGYNGDPAAIGWNHYKLHATNNCVERSGDSTPWLGFSSGQIFLATVGDDFPGARTSQPKSTDIVFKNNSFINPDDGNFFGVFTGWDILASPGFVVNASDNYWADGCPGNCVSRDFGVFPGFFPGHIGTVLGAGDFKQGGPVSCNVPDYQAPDW